METKTSGTDMVSEADLAAERAIRDLLRRERPEDALVAEEGSRDAGRSGRRWLVDPLDGTTNYLYAFPAWAVSIAVEDGEGAAVGVVHDPLRSETHAAVRGGGARLNGAPVRIRASGELGTALLATGFSYDPARRARQARTLLGVLPRVRDVRRAGAAALDLAWLACGRLDGYWERGLKPWDWAAGALLVREAGGAVAALDGSPPGLAAAGQALLPRLLELLAEAEGAT